MAVTANGSVITFNDYSLQSSSGATRLFSANVFTTGSGAYVPPANLKYIKVTMLGGGGGGGGSTPTANSFGARGGYSSVMKIYRAGPFPSPIPYSIGAGGAGGGAGSSGYSGGSSVFGSDTAGGASGGQVAPVPAQPAQSKYGSNPTPGVPNFYPTFTSLPITNGPGTVIITNQNGYYTESYGEVGPTSGVPIWYDSPSGAGTPVVVTNVPSPTAGGNGWGYGVGGGGGRTGPSGAGAAGAAGRPGIIIIEEYY